MIRIPSAVLEDESVFEMDDVPDWLWIVSAAIFIAGGILFILQQRRLTLARNALQTDHVKGAAAYKAWQWLYGRPKQKRLGYQKPKAHHHDA